MGNSYSNGWHQPGWHHPDIPWKGPKEFVIDPNEFNNLELIVSGSAVSRNISLKYSTLNKQYLC